MRLPTKRIGTTAVALLMGASVPAFALEDRVTVESRTFHLGQESCTVGVFFENSIGVTGLVAPLEIREIDPGVYPASGFWRRLNFDSRIMQSSMVCTTFCPAIYTPLRTYAVPELSSPCSGPVGHTWSASAANIDYSSPDAFMLALVAMGDASVDEDYYLRPGTDGVDRDSAILRLGFNAPIIPGQFEIDTCCTFPANHLLYVDLTSSMVVPAFTRGVVTIACHCPCESDPNCDGASTDILDVIETVSVAFRDKPSITDPGCPRARTDVDCNGVTDVVDAVRVALVSFAAFDRAVFYCDPCD